MAEIVFHYTSCHGAQEIAISGVIKLNSERKAYFTDDTYSRGVEAARRLAIPGKPVEIVFAVEEARVAGLTAPRPVGPYIGPDGKNLRDGGGTERWTVQDVPAQNVAGWTLSTL
ncbi:MAG: hypothetical protein ACRDJ9_07225 [Dehalococcoidia bacterium]